MIAVPAGEMKASMCRTIDSQRSPIRPATAANG